MSCLVAAVGCGSREPGTLATWEHGEVTAEALDAHLRTQASGAPPPADELDPWLRERLEEMVLPEVLIRRYDAAEPIRDEADAVRERYSIAQEIGRRYLAEKCPEEPVPEAELREEYRQWVSVGPIPWILLRHIYVEIAPNASERERSQRRERAGDLLRRLGEGASFVELARRHSDSSTAEAGGLIGRISREAPLDPTVLAAAWDLEDGETSGVVEVANGFHILHRETSGVEEPPSWAEAKEEVARRSAAVRRERCGAEVLQALAAERPVTIDNGALAVGDPSAEVLEVGESAYTLAALAGLADPGRSIAETPRPGERIRHFAEALLLEGGARAEGGVWSEVVATVTQEIGRRTRIEEQWRREREAVIQGKDDDTLRTYFESRREQFDSPLELDVGLILVFQEGLPGRRAAREEAQRLRRMIAAGESFEKLARDHSQHASREQSGRLGSLSWDRLRVVLGSEGIAAAAGLALGEVSAPVKIHDPPRAAYGLVKLYERVEPAPRSFEAARRDVLETMARDRVEALDRETRDMVLREVGFRIHARALAGYVERAKGQ